MKHPFYFKAGLLLILSLQTVQAGIVRDPIGVNVSAAKPMSLTVRFADTNGGEFTTTQALFCYRQLENGQCDPTAILGRLPTNRDRGSTTQPTSSITDVMTIPYSVIRSAVVRAQQVDFSDFYYVRRFTPLPGVDLGAGPGVDVYQKVTCHLAGPATVPLSLASVQVYGTDENGGNPNKLIRLSEANLPTGQVKARVSHTGTGILEGWWEVRRPGDPALRDIDLLPEAALPDDQRGLQQHFARIKRFRVRATSTGEVTINGPKYSELPRDVSGRHEILLRFDATLGRENRARLNVPGERLNLFSGAVAGFKIKPLEYNAPSSLAKTPQEIRLMGRLKKDGAEASDSVYQLVWKPQLEEGLILELDIYTDPKAEKSGEPERIIAPAKSGVLRLKPQIARQIQQYGASIRLLREDGQVSHGFEPVAVPEP